MSAFKIFSRFAELLDINITRAAAAWLRLNADGTVSQLTASQMRDNIMPDIALGIPTLGTGWSNSGGGTYVANIASGQSSVVFPFSDLQSGVYVASLNVSRTTGAVTCFSASGASSIFAQASASGAWAGFLNITSSAASTLNFRSDNATGFVGNISQIRLRRLL